MHHSCCRDRYPLLYPHLLVCSVSGLAVFRNPYPHRSWGRHSTVSTRSWKSLGLYVSQGTSVVVGKVAFAFFEAFPPASNDDPFLSPITIVVWTIQTHPDCEEWYEQTHPWRCLLPGTTIFWVKFEAFWVSGVSLVYYQALDATCSKSAKLSQLRSSTVEDCTCLE